MGIPVRSLCKIGEGSPNVLDEIERGEVRLVVNTPVGTGARTDGWEIRSAAVARGIPCITTMTGAMAAARAIAAARRGRAPVISLQELQRGAGGVRRLRTLVAPRRLSERSAFRSLKTPANGSDPSRQPRHSSTST